MGAPFQNRAGLFLSSFYNKIIKNKNSSFNELTKRLTFLAAACEEIDVCGGFSISREKL
jgi:hypothetical protein